MEQGIRNTDSEDVHSKQILFQLFDRIPELFYLLF